MTVSFCCLFTRHWDVWIYKILAFVAGFGQQLSSGLSARGLCCPRVPESVFQENIITTVDVLICCCLVAKACLTLLWPHGPQPARILCPWHSPGKNTRVGCHFLPGDLPDPEIEPSSPALAGGLFTTEQSKMSSWLASKYTQFLLQQGSPTSWI